LTLHRLMLCVGVVTGISVRGLVLCVGVVIGRGHQQNCKKGKEYGYSG